MSFIELYGRSSEAIELLNDYRTTEGKSLGTLLGAYKNGTLAEEIGATTGTGTDPTQEQRLNELAQRVEALTERAEGAVSGVEFPARRVGPSPVGGYHPHDGWGIQFKTNRPLHLGRATIDAETAGAMTVVLAKYDGKSQHEPVQSRDFTVKQGVQRINLNLQVPSAGEYLLSRKGNLTLRRGEWDGWGAQSRDGLTLVGGSKPDATPETIPNRFWYYFYDLQVAVRPDAHLPEPASLTPLY